LKSQTLGYNPNLNEINFALINQTDHIFIDVHFQLYNNETDEVKEIIEPEPLLTNKSEP
jgi:hypothetical protein